MKKKYASRFLALTLTAAVSLTSLSGCGSPAPSGTDPKASASAANTDAGASGSGEAPTLIWWTVGNTPSDDFDEAISQISDYTESRIGVRLDVKVAGYGDYDQKMNTIINAGEYFDLMFVNNHNYNKFATMGALENISATVQEVTPALYSFIPEQLWSGVTVSGNVYAVPTYKDSSSTQFWYIDDAYVQKYGIDMSSIKDMKTLDPWVRAIKEGEGSSCYPIQLSQGARWTDFFKPFDDLAIGLQPFGIRIDDETRTAICTLEDPESVEKLRQLHEWYADGIINPDANVLAESNKGKIFGNDQGWPSAVATWQTMQGVEKYDAVQVGPSVYTTASIQGSMNAISSNSQHKEEALKVLELMNTDPTFRDMCAYGTEGTFFTYNGDGSVKRIRDDWAWPSYTQGTFFIMSTQEGTDPKQWEEIQQQNENALASCCLGFTVNTEGIQNEIANCSAAWDKYKYDLLTGAADPDELLPRCIEDLKASGLDTIIEEVQKQIDEYYK